MDLTKLTAAVAEVEREFRKMAEDRAMLAQRLETARRALEQTALAPHVASIEAAVRKAYKPAIRILKTETATVAIPSKTSTPKAAGKRGRKFKFTDDQLQEIYKLRSAGDTIVKLAKQYKVTPPTIHSALKRASANGSGAAAKH